MFSIFRRNRRVEVNLSGIGTDMHSHVLPGIDDGSPDPETSVQLIRGLTELGYSKLIATPHIMWDLYRNDAATIDAARQLLQPECEREGVQAPVHAAAEYFMDDYFDSLVEEGKPLRTLTKNWVLIEFSFVGAPVDLKQKIFALQIKGYQPVIAHPERYNYLYTNRKWFDEMKELGCLFQLNILSLTSYYGRIANELARYLIKKEYINLLGTDLHHQRHLQVLRTSGRIMEQVNVLLDSGKLMNNSL